MTTETTMRQMVAELEAELREWSVCDETEKGFVLAKKSNCTYRDPHISALDHTSAEGERWFAEKLLMDVRVSATMTYGVLWVAEVKGRPISDRNRSTAIRLAIEAAAKVAHERRQEKA